MPHRWTMIFLLLLIPFGAAAEQGSPTHYAIIDLGTLPGGTQSEAYAINNSGQVVGWSDSAKEDMTGYDRKIFIHNHAVQWDKGHAHDLGLLKGYSFSAATAINDKGEIAGSWELHYLPPYGGGPAGLFQSFLWQRGQKTILSLENAKGINSRGWICGRDYDGHPFLSVSGKTTNLGFLPGATEGIANGITNSGEIVGWVMGEAANKVNGDYRAFLYKNGKMNNLDTLPIGKGEYSANFSQAFAINDKGLIVGVHAFRPVMWKSGSRQILGTLPEQEGGVAYAVNNIGQIVGSLNHVNNQGRSRAFLFQQGTLYDLNDLCPAHSDWILEEARGINDKGQIVGYGKNDGQERAFLLTPLKRIH